MELTTISSHSPLTENPSKQNTEAGKKIPSKNLHIAVQLSCGSKHDRLVELVSNLEKTSACVPRFFGFTNEQIQGLLSENTKALWHTIPQPASSFPEHKLLMSVNNDIRTSNLPFSTEQEKALDRLRGKILIVRSSSNEDGQVVNAGGNKSIGGIQAEKSALQDAIAQVVSSYFSAQSLKNRFHLEDVGELPLCSVLVMEQIIEEQNDRFPIVSGVMMTSKPGWSAPDEEGITHITASWGFGSGTNNQTICDEWVLTEHRHYPTIRRKISRFMTPSDGIARKEPNEPALREIPCLTEAQLRQLKDIGQRVERHYQKPMDMEFVIKNDRLYVVQARPIQAPNIVDSTYLDPMSISPLSTPCQGDVIVAGLHQVLSLEHDEIIFAKNLEKAEKISIPGKHKAVIVYTHESSNTHPAVNFASQRPPIPCFVLPYEKWKQCKPWDWLKHWQLCPQTGLLYRTLSDYPLHKGLFLHPARFPITIAEGKPMQAESHHATIQECKQRLRATPEELKTRLDEIRDKLSQLFVELSARTLAKDRLADIVEKLHKATVAEIEEMERAAQNGHMTRLAFHAGILRQLMDQSGKPIVGGHSISSLEASTQLPDCMDSFLQNHQDAESRCQLALLGLHGFDEPIQNKWISFLEQNSEESQLQQLLTDLQKLDALNKLTHWFSIHFSDASTPQMEALLANNAENEKHHSSLSEFGSALCALTESLENIRSIPDLEGIWKTLQETSKELLDFCKTHQLRDPLFMELIDLWDLSTKAVRISQLFTKEEEEKQFGDRVTALIEFAAQASEGNALNYSLEKLIKTMRSWRQEEFTFSVQHWLVPVSQGALASLQTDDQRLTVIHQNLLQAAAYGNLEHLPRKLATAYGIFQEKNTCSPRRFGNNGGTFISIEKDRASVRINIPLNLHSTVVTFSQKRGSDEIEVMAYFRSSDNGMGHHLNFFQAFSGLANIPLKDSQIINSDLKVVFALKSDEETLLLSRAINKVNEMSLGNQDYIRALCFLFDPARKDTETIKEKIITYVWEELKKSGIYLSLSSQDPSAIWEFLEEKNQLSEITTRVIEELEGKQPESDFSKEFTGYVLKFIPSEKSKEIVWNALVGKKRIFPHRIPKEIRNDLLPKLFAEKPKRARVFCKDTEAMTTLTKLMSSKLDSGGLSSKDEVDLLFHMALQCTDGIPEKWINALKAWKEYGDIEKLIDKKKNKYLSSNEEENLKTLSSLVSYQDPSMEG